MKRLIAISCLLLLIGAKGCGDDSPSGSSYRSPSIVWKTKLADNGLLRDVIEADIQFNNAALFSGISNTTRSLYLIDTESGEIKWKWSDYFPNDVFWMLRYPYQYQSQILIPEGRNLYLINLSDGKTIWKKSMESFASEDFAFGVLEDYYLIVDYINENNSFEGRIARGNLLTGSEPSSFIVPEYSREVIQPQNGLVGTLDGVSQIQINGKEHFVVFFGDPNEVLYDIDMFLGLYNLDDAKWVYSKKPSVPRAKSRCGRNPIISGTKVFNFCGYSLVCHDLLTGDLCWSKTIQAQPFSVMGWVDNKIVITSQDSKTHCIDPENGSTLWELPTEPNPSLIRELNGIAYFIGGGGRFYAIDVNKGKIVWDFPSPDLNGNPPAYFMQGVRIVKSDHPNKPDKVIVASERNAFCYQAAK